MYCKPVLDFFLGALSPAGFCGWFAEAAAAPGQQTYLIKAGPGCGKSTFMRRLAHTDIAAPAARGAMVERIHCSSDPASLDGVLLQNGHALLLDATAPHTLDCKYPGAAERVLSFYDTLDNDTLAAHRADILRLGARNAALLQQAAAHFALACALLARRRASAGAVLDTEKLQRFTARFATRTMPPRCGNAHGRQSHRLLSAPTPGGITIFTDTIPLLCWQALYVLHDSYGAASAVMLAQLAEHAAANGYDAILCHCSSDQRGKLDHLFIPALGLGFVTSNPWHRINFANQHNLHASRFMDFNRLGEERRTLRYQKHLADSLIAKTCAAQTAAKTVHDELEKYYISATDFSGIDALFKKTQAEIFGAV